MKFFEQLLVHKYSFNRIERENFIRRQTIWWSTNYVCEITTDIQPVG